MNDLPKKGYGCGLFWLIVLLCFFVAAWLVLAGATGLGLAGLLPGQVIP